jgi:hypothetical protein
VLALLLLLLLLLLVVAVVQALTCQLPDHDPATGQLLRPLLLQRLKLLHLLRLCWLHSRSWQRLCWCRWRQLFAMAVASPAHLQQTAPHTTMQCGSRVDCGVMWVGHWCIDSCPVGEAAGRASVHPSASVLKPHLPCYGCIYINFKQLKYHETHLFQHH